ncbi:fe-s protein [Leptolyngbya sp. Heron Island J]|uniref:MOSC domain-containing protein n=1 Tax=Leptolyngbya sp. Heron Island J TaxID=1385935 RepID=UPI0003B9888D|nr:MOSC domain-containing protein [Leptolyngbya sp. Heron Island J]ESA36084.1 fe-s protein [Leptolyngbya sp. Heron Island J]
MSVIKLSGLTTYPIKSAAGVSLSQSQVTSRGLQHDRRWMVCDRNGKFLTQRKFPKMALIQVAVDETLHLSIAGIADASLELPAVPAAQPLSVEVWGDQCTAWSMGDQAAQWLSNFLGIDAQLAYMPDSTHRPSDHGRFETPNSFADAYPFLLISEASLADLNDRLEQPVPMNRFRPNLVVTGCEPFAEDTWQQIQIGDIVFDVAKACSRCSIPGVEQSTGEQGKEPLKTLATYRRWEHAIWFGQNLIAHSEGTLNVGDAVKILA